MTNPIEAWRGEFGNDYVERNALTIENHRMLVPMWARMLRSMNPPPSAILEVGANVGMNLAAIREMSQAALYGIEPNAKARRVLANVARAALDGDVRDMSQHADGQFPFVFTAGVLIHIPPDDLLAACREIVRVSSRYVLCAEYFSARPREIPYRDNTGMMWARDFGKFYLEEVGGLRLVDHGFFWTGAGAIDDLTWTLMEKA